MRISIHRERTVAELREHIHATYGTSELLQAHVRAHPEDVLARVALHDLREYADDPPEREIRETEEIVIPDRAVDDLTLQRLQLLLTLKSLDGGSRSIRALARAVDRDVKNVSEDVRALKRWGLVHVEDRGPGRPHRVVLPGDRIDLHLVEAEA